MDEALVEDSEHQVDDEHRQHEQREHPALAGLEDLCSAGEVGGDRGGKRLAGDALNGVYRLPERGTRPEVERHGHCGDLARVVYA